VVALVVVASPLRAGAGDDKVAAKEALREGMRQYEIGDFTSALAAFKRAYLNYEEPAFLYNIAQCERLLGQKSEALREYKMYLHKVPAASNRVEVQKIVADLQAALAVEKQAQEAPPQGPMEPRPELTRAPSPAPVVLVAAPPLVVAPPLVEKPVYKKWWLWTVVGVAVAGAGVGVGLGLGLKASNHTTLPNIGPSSQAVRF
jgi:tetratricopeptide (TPR) repeat protein